MKKLLYSLLTLAAALTVASCQQELEGGSVHDDGTLVDATFSVSLGTQTKAFADGTTVDKLYAGIYEIKGTDTYEHVTHTDTPVAISEKAGSVSFTGKIKRGHSYKIVFWAQKDGAPYTLAWDPAPTVTVTTTGDANDETRDAFYGEYLTNEVTGNIVLTDPVTLKRPFAQVNVLVPNANVADFTAGSLVSEMTVANAPTVLNLATKETSSLDDYSFSSAAIAETAFESYATTHKYVAMNYVLVDQTATDLRYNVTFKVSTSAQTTGDTPKSVANTPLKPNGRTNIVGNIFAEDFDITVPVIIGNDPASEHVVTTVTVTVGQTEANAVEVNTATATRIDVAVNHPINTAEEAPTFSYDPEGVATAVWVIDDATAGTGHIEVTANVANGTTKITATFPAVTKAVYSAQTAEFWVTVGDGINVADKEVVEQSVSFGDTKSKEVIIGTSCELGEYSDLPAPTAANLAPNSALVYSLGDGTTADAFTLTETGVLTINARGKAEVVATAPQVETPDKIYSPASDTFTLTVKERLTNPDTQATVNGNSIVLTWTVDSQAVSYRIEYLLESEDVSASEHVISDIDKAVGTYTMENMSADTYFLQVVAVAPENSFYANASDVDLIEITVSAPVETNTIADIIKQITSTDSSNPSSYSANLAGAVVSYVNGKNVYLEDASGAILLFMENSGLTAGQTISGTISGTGYLYNGLPEITALGTDYTAAAGGAIPETTVTLAELLANYDNYISRRIKLEGVTVTDGITASDRDGTISQSNSSIAVRSQISSNGPALDANTIGDFITFPAIYNTNKQLSYFEVGQFTQTGIVPVLSAPDSATVNADVASYTWNITSNTAWTITPGTGVTATPASGNGNAEVTLTFDANTTNEAKTLTATASAEGCEDVTITITQNGTGTVITTKTYTLTITTASLGDGAGSGTNGYTKYNGSYDLTATATDGSTMTVSITTNQVMPNSSKLQFQKNTGYIINTTDLGSIDSITIADVDDLSKVIGSSEHPGTGTTGGFFTVSNATNGARSTSSIEIVFTK